MSVKTWNALSSNFDEHVMEIANEDLHGIISEQIERLAGKSSTAADLGCGPGSLLPHLCSRFENVYAVDYADQLLNIARERYNYRNVEYYCHNLASTSSLPFSADVTFSVNALITDDYNDRKAIAKSLWRTTRKGGVSVVIVPSMESVIHTYQTLVRCNDKDNMDHEQTVKDLNRLYSKEVLSPVDGIVNVGGAPTKCFTQDEIAILLSEVGFTVDQVQKVEYSWDEEIDDAPGWLTGPYPWDWLVVSRKL